MRIADDEEILSAARELATSLRSSKLPDFVTGRFGKLETLLAMLTDADWKLGDRERGPVLAALAYLCDPEDLIPDSIPGIGLLDDAVMIELVFHELRHEIEAYEDFVRFRKSLPRGASAQRGAGAHGPEARAAARAARRADAPAPARRTGAAGASRTRQACGGWSVGAQRGPSAPRSAPARPCAPRRSRRARRSRTRRGSRRRGS